MSLVQFQPNSYEEELISNVLEPRQADSTLTETLFVAEIENSHRILPELYHQGIRFLVSFEYYPAFAVLQNSPWITEISHKVSSPASVSVFEIKSQRRNPDDEEDFKITSQDLRPDPVKWFETFLNRYTDWQEAWWREVLQNSVDTCIEAIEKLGRKGKIDCDIHTFDNSDEVQITVSDNGLGMDKKTLIEAFLTPGGSGKREMQTGRSVAGGLGKAKEMLFHAWPWWNVWTQMDGRSGYYVEAKYGPYFEGNLLKSEKRDRPTGPGTTVSVSMKKDKCVEKGHLVKFISYSDFPITVTFRRMHHKADGTAELLEQEQLRAENQITVSEPIRVLQRRDGSPWAKVYHMPHAKKFKEVTVRANGLYLFTAPGEYGFAGKVIVELSYKPRGHQWDDEEQEWVSMPPEKAKRQSITEFGPLELLTESRDQLQYEFKRQLDRYFQELARKPEVALKPIRKINRVRVVNKRAEKIDFSRLFEKVNPTELMNNPKAAVEEIKNLVQRSEEETLQEFARRLVRGEIPEPEKAGETFSTNELIKIKGADPQKLAAICKQITATPSLIEDEGGEDLPSAGSSMAINFISLLEYLDKIKTAAVDTSVDSELYQFYKDDVIPIITADFREKSEGVPQNAAQNIIKMLNWSPDFIFSDETSKPTPPAPQKFYPDHFTAKEKQIAKFWVEAIRLAHILQGYYDPELQAGFLFEDPGSLNYLGEFVASAGREVGRSADDIGAFRAVLLAPAMISPKSKSKYWIHRYSLRDLNDVAEIVAIVFHEVVHSHLNLTSDIDHGHDSDFASLLTRSLVLAMRYSSLFNKLARHICDRYPIKGERREEGEAEIAKKIVAGQGYYQVSCKGVRGRNPKFSTIAAALEYSDKVIKDRGTECSFGVYYLPEDGKNPVLVTEISRYSTEEDPEEFAERLAKAIQRDWTSLDYGYAEDLWKRRRLKRRS